MFKKYNIDELFLAYINIYYIKRNGELEIFGRSITILKKVKEDKYINLKDGKIIPSSDNRTVKEIAFIEPLSNYYQQDGKKKRKFTRKKLMEELKENYNELNEKRIELEKTYTLKK